MDQKNFEGSQKRRNSTDTIANSKIKRKTAVINRLGVTSEYDENDDSLFEKLQQKNSTSTTNNDTGMAEKNADQTTPSPISETVNENGSEKATSMIETNADQITPSPITEPVNENAASDGSDDVQKAGSKHQNQSTCEKNRTELMMLSAGEKILYSKMIDMMTELKVLQKNVMELRDGNRMMKQNDMPLKKLKREQLIEFGLPLKNEKELINFDTKLKDNEFYKRTVLLQQF